MPLTQRAGSAAHAGERQASNPQGKRDDPRLDVYCLHAEEVVSRPALLLTLSIPATAQGPQRVAIGDWPEMRGPSRDGGLARDGPRRRVGARWRELPSGGYRTAAGRRRSSWANRVYVQNPAERGADLQERVMALDADTGRDDLGTPVQPLPE